MTEYNKSDKSDDDIIATAKARFAQAVDAESENRKDAVEDLRFSEGDQWPERIKNERDKDRRPCLVINKVPSFTRQVVNDIRQIRPSIKVRGVDSQSDPETAEVINGMIRAIEQDSSAESAYDWAMEYAVRSGCGYWRIKTEYETAMTFDQVIKIERITNPFSVYLDPAADNQDGSDAMWGFVIDDMPKTEFESKYPDAEGEWNEQGEGDESDWFTKETVRVAEYWKIDEEPFTLRMYKHVQTGQVLLSDDNDEVPQEFVLAAERESTRRKVVQCIMTGAEILETNEFPGDYIPIVRVLGREINIEGEQKIKGMVRDIKDPQRQYNYFRSASTERVALYAKAPYVGPKGSFKSPKWRSANTKNYAFLEYDVVPGAPPPGREPPPDISTGFANEVMVAGEELKSVTGIYDPGLGARSNEVSGVAIDGRKAESDVSNFDFVDNLARAMTYSGKILVGLIPKIYTGPRALRILRPGNKEETVQVNQPYVDPETQKEQNFQLDAGRYDVVVDIGPSYATQRKEASASMTEFMKVYPNAAPLIGDLMAENFDWPQADEIAKRLKLTLPPGIMANENPAIMQAMQQKDGEIQQMQQQIQFISAEYEKLAQQMQNKTDENEIKQADLMRKVKADMMKHIEGMTSLELQAGRDLNDAGVAYQQASNELGGY